MKIMELGALLLLIALPIVSVSAQGHPVVVVDFRELQLVPEETDSLINSVDVFHTDSRLSALLASDDTIFWEAIGSYDSSLSLNMSLTSYAIVQINNSGFYESIVALNSESLTLERCDLVNPDLTANYSLAVRTATDFFADDGHYWGLSEEIVLVPGSHVGLAIDAIWLFEFYLVGETERWALMIDTDGILQHFTFTDIPCKDCVNLTPVVVIAFSSSLFLVVAVGLFMRNRRFRFASNEYAHD